VAGLAFSSSSSTFLSQPQASVLGNRIVPPTNSLLGPSTAAIAPVVPELPPAQVTSSTAAEFEEGELRLSVAAVTPEAQSMAAAAATGTPSPQPSPRATVSATPSPRPSSSPPATASAASGAATTATATRTPTPAAGGSPPCEPGSDIFCVYTVQAGDTLSGIASRFALKGNEDVAPWELLVNSNKPDIVDQDDLLQIGQKLRIPLGIAPPVAAAARTTPAAGSTPSPARTAARPSGVIHTVLSTETLLDIANQYNVEVSEIMAANRAMTDPNKLSIGQELFVPNPRQFAPARAAAVAAPSPAAATAAGSSGGTSGSSGGGSSPASISGPRSASGLIWPVSGPISSYFGPSHPLGIDVDLFANPNAPIGASAAGTVTFAGGNSCCSYGLYVVIDHGNGLQTLYAHLSKISVSTGQKVTQGQIVGNAGRTGYATGNHLHLEVHKNGSPVNPTAYLP
jgi:murein DD-endopeptidase MepM/ murein hydrolase activator NlpD